MNLEFSWQPAIDGSIDTVQMTIDEKSVTGWGDGQAKAILVEQGGQLYGAVVPASGAVTSWRPIQSDTFSEASFRAVTEPDYRQWDDTRHPDFSAGGADITFGFLIGNRISGTFTQLYDNWSLSVSTAGAGQIQGTVWDDRDGNGSRGPGEPGLDGWTVYVDYNGNQQLDDGVEPSAVTGIAGAYTLSQVSPGQWDVAQLPRAGWAQTSPAASAPHRVTVSSGQTAGDVDFGNHAFAFIVSTLDDESDGDYSDGDLSLREALWLASQQPGHDVIAFKETLRGGTIVLDAELGELAIDSNVDIQGLGADQLTVDAAGNSRVFNTVAGIAATISSLTISGGEGGTDLVAGRGGAMHIVAGAAATLDSVIVTRNAGSLGGGIYNAGSLTLRHAIVSDNSAYNGGGIHNHGTASLFEVAVLRNHATNEGGGISTELMGLLSAAQCIVSDNTSDWGGGLYVGQAAAADKRVELTKVTVSGNTAAMGGGIFTFYQGFVNLRDSVVYGNEATSHEGGGGILNNGHMAIVNTTISGNAATSTMAYGGGIKQRGIGSLALTNVTVTGNRSYYVGGGMSAAQTSPPSLYNTIVAGNFLAAGTTPSDVQGAFSSASSHNLIGTGDESSGLVHGVNGNMVGTIASPLNPGLGLLQDNGGLTLTHALLPQSPAVDAGSNVRAADAGLTTDQRGTGFSRSVDGNTDGMATVDIGAFEANFGANGEIHGIVWNDLNGDGILDANESGLPGRTVFLDTDGDGQVDPTELSTTTGPDGSYQFLSLVSPGTYTVTELLPLGWILTRPLPARTYTVPLAAGQVIHDANFGNRQSSPFGPLVSGVNGITAGYDQLPGPLEIVGGGVAIAFGDDDTAPLVQQQPPIVVGAGIMGSGRGVCFGHEGFFFPAYNTLLDNEVFIANAASWLGQGGKRILFDKFSYDTGWGRQVHAGLVELLGPAGYTITVASGNLTAAELGQTDILAIAARWTAFTSNELAAIEAFVQNGGGVLATGLAWSWLSGGGHTIENYPMNAIAAMFGLRYVNGMISDPTDNLAEPSEPIFYEFYTAPDPSATFRVVSMTPVPGSTVSAAPASIVVTFDRALDPSTVTRANVVLRASGGDGTFADGNELAIVPQSVALSGPQQVTLGLSAGSLPVDTYQLVVRSSTNNALQFDGTNDFVTIGDLGNRPTQGTIAFWMRSDALQNYPNLLTTGPLTGNAGGNRGIRFEQDSAGNFGVNIGSDSATGSSEFLGHGYTNSLQTNRWYHVALVWDSSTNHVIGYLDGVQVFDDLQTFWPTRFNEVRVGVGFDTTRLWKGAVDDVQFWTVARSAAQIASDMAGGLAGNDPSLMAYWHMDEGTGQVVHDRTLGHHDGILGVDDNPGDDDPSWIVRAGICDSTGVPLDGEFSDFLPSGDGVPGGDFVAQFTVDNGHHGWQNTVEPCDVDGAGTVAPLDVLILINYINAHPNNPILPVTPPPPPYLYYDVDNDGACTPADVLRVINHINNQLAGSLASGEGSLPLVPSAANLRTIVSRGAWTPARPLSPRRIPQAWEVAPPMVAREPRRDPGLDPCSRPAADDLDAALAGLDAILPDIAADIAGARCKAE
jgi:hypothetical protein